MRHLYAILLLSLSSSAHALDLEGLKEQFNKARSSNAEPSASQGSNQDVLASFSNKDQVSALRQALSQGAEVAVSNLAKEDGYLGNPQVRIPLPEKLQKVDGLLRNFGMGKYADDLTTAMNRAAEAAVPEAKNLLIGAVKKMTVTDVKNILMGEQDAATQYFRKNTETALAAKFQPIVGKSMEKVKLAQTYDQFAAKGAKLGLLDERDSKLNDYITRKALDGLFVMMAEQEKEIRANPLQATGSIAKKIFSAIKF